MAKLGDLSKAAVPGTVEPNRSYAVEQGTDEGGRGVTRPLQTGGRDRRNARPVLGCPLPQGRHPFVGQPRMSLGNSPSLSAAPPCSSPKTRYVSGKLGAQPGWGAVCPLGTASHHQGD